MLTAALSTIHTITKNNFIKKIDRYEDYDRKTFTRPPNTLGSLWFAIVQPFVPLAVQPMNRLSLGILNNSVHLVFLRRPIAALHRQSLHLLMNITGIPNYNNCKSI